MSIKRFARLISFAIPLSVIVIPLNGAVASPPILNGLTVSLDSRGGSTISGTTWAGQDGTSKNATLQTSTQYNTTEQYVTMNDRTSPSYASLGYGTGGDAINPTGDMTVEAWVKFNNVQSAAWNIVATKWFPSATGNGNCTNPTFHFGLYFGKPNLYLTGAGAKDLRGTSTVSSGTWHQIAFTVVNPDSRGGSGSGGVGTVRLYLDGLQEKVATGSDVYQTPDTGCEMVLGDGRTATSPLGIDGGLEKFRMYNRALTPEEINKNYRADANIHNLTAGPFNTTIPSITGPHRFAATETGTVGTWLNTPTAYSYQWSRSATVNGSYLAIIGATSSTYTTTSADVGKYLKIMVGASNGAGTFFETSTATTVIAKSAVNLTFTSANQYPIYRTTNYLNVSTSGVSGSVTFKVDGKQIAGCRKISSTSTNSYIAQCPWKPSVHKAVNLSATFTPTDSNYLSDSRELSGIQVVARSNKR